MKDQSPPTQLCPFCGKSFKRLKSHLHYCKMANTKSTVLSTEHMDTNMSVSQLAVKNMNEKKVSIQCSKFLGKSKTDNTECTVRTKKQIQKNKTASSSLIAQPKTSSNTETCLTQPKIIKNIREQKCLKKNKNNINVGKPNDTADISAKHAGMEHSEIDPSDPKLYGTNQVVTLLKEQALTPIPATVSSAPRLHEGLAGPDTKGNLWITAAPPFERNALPNLDVSCTNINMSNTVKSTEVECSSSPVCDHSSKKTKHATQQNSESSFPCTTPTQLSIVSRASAIVMESVGTQLLPDISLTLRSQNMRDNTPGDEKVLETAGKTFLSPCKFQSTVDMKSDHDSLGLQWMPHLYTNYVRQNIVPGRQDHWHEDQRLTKRSASSELKPDLHTPVLCGSFTDNQIVFRHLMDVRLGDLPSWLAGHRFSATMISECFQNAWRNYYNKYINVRKGGVGGLAILLAGYCVLSYAWNFNNIKQDRWRKYH